MSTPCALVQFIAHGIRVKKLDFECLLFLHFNLSPFHSSSARTLCDFVFWLSFPQCFSRIAKNTIIQHFFFLRFDGTDRTTNESYANCSQKMSIKMHRKQTKFRNLLMRDYKFAFDARSLYVRLFRADWRINGEYTHCVLQFAVRVYLCVMICMSLDR